MDSVIESERSNRSGESRSVKNTEMLLRFERNRFYVMVRQGLLGRHNLAGAENGRAIENANRRISD